ncbi:MULTISPECIES: thioredoxin [Ehrlichia]|uniref:Thioredoxin n=1 Tax=Ehrlichia cf. muris str. EmCRT TaxID=1359167 RepID=A0A0F3NC92_9RICK|nr:MULTISPECIES: thioredoxin [Ehrlichia]KJV65640.1 thioredoxin [Ehrlichia cf. muris str. EmCRT]OUC04441.1 thioredoxin [Ehrlichia sp. Wisconsin_h]
MVEQIGDSEFENKVISSNEDILILVDFWAPWCGPCKTLEPQLEKLAQQYVDKVKIYKLNIEDNQDVAIRYGVSAVPTILMFKNGKKLSQVIGADVAKIINELNNHIN